MAGTVAPGACLAGDFFHLVRVETDLGCHAAITATPPDDDPSGAIGVDPLDPTFLDRFSGPLLDAVRAHADERRDFVANF